MLKPKLSCLKKLGQFVTFLWTCTWISAIRYVLSKTCFAQSENDITIATNLIESRYLSGAESLCNEFHQQLLNDFPWSSRDFYQAKLDEQKQRHQQYHSTSYNLEPNIKSSPGGLRDIQTVGWIAKTSFPYSLR